MTKHPEARTTGWRPTCEHESAPRVPCVVLDHYAGSGTTGLVAHENGCDAILIEGNPEYVQLIEERLKPTRQAGLFTPGDR